MRYTEASHPLTLHIDQAEPRRQVELLAAAHGEIFGSRMWGPGLFESEFVRQLARVQERILRVLAHPKGCVILSGAGTSGRLAVHAAASRRRDASVAGRLVGLLAGGMAAFFEAQEQIEDRPAAGIADLEACLEDAQEVSFVGISCGLSAAYVAGQVHRCLQRESTTVAVIGFNPLEEANPRILPGIGRSFGQILTDMVDRGRGILLNPIIGPEPITGSTRMKSGTATKIMLDVMLHPGDVHEMLGLYYRAADGIGPERRDLIASIHTAAEALRCGRSLAYLGHGKAAFTAVLDASECPPTFGARVDQVRAFVAGDMSRHIPGIDLTNRNLADFNRWDQVGNCAVFVTDDHLSPEQEELWNAMEHRAVERFAWAASDLLRSETRDLPEFLAWSARDLALKWSLNTLTTCTFIAVGKVHGNRMIDLRITNAKLWFRAVRIVSEVAEVELAVAESALRQVILQAPDPNGRVPVEELISRAAPRTGIILQAIAQVNS